MNTTFKLPYIIHRQGSNIALGFWIILIAACGACLFALLYNDFYQPVSIIGLLALAALFLFFAFATRWKERIEFREGELIYIHTAKISKTRSWSWPYTDLTVASKRHSSRVKSGNTYTTVISYTVSIHNQKNGGMIPLDHHLKHSGDADAKAKLYTSIITSSAPQQKSASFIAKNAVPGRPR
jgi:hypothetical protein